MGGLTNSGISKLATELRKKPGIEESTYMRPVKTKTKKKDVDELMNKRTNGQQSNLLNAKKKPIL